MILRLLILCLALILPACVSSPQPRVFEVPTGRAKANIPFWWMPDEAAQATVVIFTGGPGALGRNDNDALNGPQAWERHSFLVRDWRLFQKEGFNVALVGRARDRVQEMNSRTGSPRRAIAYRASAEHSREIREVLLQIKQLAPGKDIWLVGHSMGSISSANASIANPDIIAGQVLLGSITHKGGARGGRGGPDDIMPPTGLDFGKIRVPTLIMTHSQDECLNTKPEHARENYSALNNAPRKELVFLSGGSSPRGETCGAEHYHGFPGLEKEVVNRTASWIRAPSSK